jgi:hypothetical protein
VTVPSRASTLAPGACLDCGELILAHWYPCRPLRNTPKFQARRKLKSFEPRTRAFAKFSEPRSCDELNLPDVL